MQRFSHLPLLLEVSQLTHASGQTCLTLGARGPVEINKCTWICLFCCRFPAVSFQPAAQILVSKAQVRDLVLSTIKFHPLSTVPALRLLQPSSPTDIPSALPLPPTWCHQQMPSAPSNLLLQGLAVVQDQNSEPPRQGSPGSGL